MQIFKRKINRLQLFCIDFEFDTIKIAILNPDKSNIYNLQMPNIINYNKHRMRKLSIFDNGIEWFLH